MRLGQYSWKIKIRKPNHGFNKIIKVFGFVTCPIASQLTDYANVE